MQRLAFQATMALFLVVMAFSILLVARRFDIPPAPPAQLLHAVSRSAGTAEPVPPCVQTTADAFPHLGSAPIFSTLLPKPPAPPPPPPSIEMVTADWSLVAIFPGKTVAFENKRTGELWMMKVNEGRAVNYGRQTLIVWLLGVDEMAFAIRLGYDDAAGECRAIRMFEP